MTELPPGFALIVGGLLYPFVKRLCGGNRLLPQIYLLGLPLLSLLHLLSFPEGTSVGLSFAGLELTPIRVDRLSLVWGYVFHIASFLVVMYALHVDDTVQHVAGLSYAGSALGAAFAGDLITLFVFWELTAITSVFLIWARRSQRAPSVGLRYFVIQVLSGVILLTGVVLHYSQTHSLAFGALGTSSLSGKLIFLAFGIKCAFPLLHNWLQDAYPEATVTGSVVLSAFTTKLAVYALARGFAGTELLIPIGVIMTVFPIFFAVIENDLRRVLAYSLNNQLGFMVVGVGIGTELALNGAAAHAFAHIIYKALLFMAMGAVLFRTGTIKASELGGLHRSMPWTTAFCIVGSLSISGFPLFSGFVSKSMTLTAAAELHVAWVALGLLIASAGVVDHSGIKIPFFAFFAHDSGRRVQEAPWNMLLAMGAAAALCLGIGLYPSALYRILPYPVQYVPYTAGHVITSLQLLLFAALAFVVLWRTKLYPAEIAATNLDSDWLYRRALPGLLRRVWNVGARVDRAARAEALGVVRGSVQVLARAATPPGWLGDPWSTSTTSMWIGLFLAFALGAFLF